MFRTGQSIQRPVTVWAEEGGGPGCSIPLFLN